MGLSQRTRLLILDAVMRRPGIGIAELVREIGLHRNTLREHAHVLEDAGLIASTDEVTGRRGRPRALYFLVEAGAPSPVVERRVRAAQERGDLYRRVYPSVPTALDPEALRQVDVLYAHLVELGLEPLLEEPTLTLDLQPCPLGGLVPETRGVACRVHRRLVELVLAQAGGPLELAALTPFTSTHSCRLRLRRRCEAADPPAAGGEGPDAAILGDGARPGERVLDRDGGDEALLGYGDPRQRG